MSEIMVVYWSGTGNTEAIDRIRWSGNQRGRKGSKGCFCQRHYTGRFKRLPGIRFGLPVHGS